jgi:hypothetical protein
MYLPLIVEFGAFVIRNLRLHLLKHLLVLTVDCPLLLCVKLLSLLYEYLVTDLNVLDISLISKPPAACFTLLSLISFINLVSDYPNKIYLIM